MPPSLPPGVSNATVVAPRGLDRVIALLDLDGFGLALESNEFTQQEWVERILRLVRDEDPNISSKGLKELRATILDLAKMQATKFEETHESKDDHGHTIKRVASTKRLLSGRGRPVLTTLDENKELPDGEGPQVIRPIVHRDDVESPAPLPDQ